jgi:hypothetical protein
VKRLVGPLAGLLLAACGPAGGGAASPSAQCARRCQIVFDCLELPTGPADRDREEFAECVGSCVDDLAAPCRQEAALDCLDCYERLECERVTTGACDAVCAGACEPVDSPGPTGG